MIKAITFAAIKEKTAPEIEISQASGLTTATLLQCLVEQYPNASELLKSCRVSRDLHILSSNDIIHDNDILYILPPSSGG